MILGRGKSYPFEKGLIMPGGLIKKRNLIPQRREKRNVHDTLSRKGKVLTLILKALQRETSSTIRLSKFIVSGRGRKWKKILPTPEFSDEGSSQFIGDNSFDWLIRTRAELSIDRGSSKPEPGNIGYENII